MRLGTRAVNALDRANITKVAGLLCVSPASLRRLRGVGKRTCRELLDCQGALRDQLGIPPEPAESRPAAGAATEPVDDAALGIDLLVHRVLPPAAASDVEQTVLVEWLALDLDGNLAGADLFPSQTDVARRRGPSPGAVHQIRKRAVALWQRDPAITRFRNDLFEGCRIR